MTTTCSTWSSPPATSPNSLKNPSVARYLERHQPDIARELQDLIETIGREHTGVL
jgi:hypothetical protein